MTVSVDNVLLLFSKFVVVVVVVSFLFLFFPNY